MGLLDRFEQRLDRLVNGAFAKAFKAEVQPVEIASAIQREMEDHAAVIARGRTVVPNSFTIDLAPRDHERLSVYSAALRGELAAMVQEYAAEQQYTLISGVAIKLGEDTGLDTGVFRVRSEAAPNVENADFPVVTPKPVVRSGQARLIIDGVSHALTKPVTRVGRGSEADIRIEDPGISRFHAEFLMGQDVTVRDLGSTNGTFLAGSKIHDAPLQDGDVLQLGKTTITFRRG